MGIEERIRTLPTWLEVDLDAMLHNIELIKHRLQTGNNRHDAVRVLLTVKADAYGHGAVQVARAAAPVVDRFGVATVDEAVELADAGIDNGILILSPVLADEMATAVSRGFSVTASSASFVEELSRCARRLGCVADLHLELDTGMGRTGFFADEWQAVARRVGELPGLRLAGLYTHFPVSDTDPQFTRAQLAAFLEAVRRLEGTGASAPLHHAANSAAIAGVPESHLHMVRPGLAVYGYHSAGLPTDLPVGPVMSWKCRLVQVRRVPSGTSISYGRTSVTERPTIVGVLPVGYGHGYPFRLSNRGAVLAGGRRAAIMGRVTMDMTMVDLTDVEPLPQAGDEVVLVGRQGEEEITADDLAAWAGTISYEILTGVGKRVARVYLREGRAITLKTLLGVQSTDSP